MWGGERGEEIFVFRCWEGNSTWVQLWGICSLLLSLSGFIIYFTVNSNIIYKMNILLCQCVFCTWGWCRPAGLFLPPVRSERRWRCSGRSDKKQQSEWWARAAPPGSSQTGCTYSASRRRPLLVKQSRERKRKIKSVPGDTPPVSYLSEDSPKISPIPMQMPEIPIKLFASLPNCVMAPIHVPYTPL